MRTPYGQAPLTADRPGLSPEVVNQARELARAGKYEEAKLVMEKKLEEAEDVQVYLLGDRASGFCGG
mgnify:CR=1 FL=1